MKPLRYNLFILALTFLLMLPGTRSGKTQEGKWLLHYIVSGDNALLFNRPELVCGGEVRRMEWSPDGNYAVAVSAVAPPYDPNRPAGTSTANVTVWNNAIHRARTVWSAPFNVWDIWRTHENVNWLPATDVYLLHIAGTDIKGASAAYLLLLLPLRDTVREIPMIDRGRVEPNPVQPLVLLQEYFGEEKSLGEPHDSRLRILHADGSLQDAQDFPQKEMILDSWAPDGKSFYAVAYGARVNGKRHNTFYAMDAVTGQWKTLEARPDVYSAAPPAAPKSGLRVVRTSAVVELEGEKRTIHPAWLATDAKTGPPRSLIAADCEEAILSPKGDAVLYRTKEGAFVLPLTKVPAAPFTETLKKVAMSNAKQLGLGMVMYTQDYDEAFPPGEFNIAEVVNPYVKNPDVFEGFTYSYPAKLMTDIAKPAETIMGTVAGPGGEAVIYADGHVAWRDKK